jgi:hypothetical protein
MHWDEYNVKDEFSILKQVFGVTPEPQEPAREVCSGRAEDFSYEGLMTIPGRFKPGIDKMPGVYPPQFYWVPLYAAEDMVQGTLLNNEAEPVAIGSGAFVFPCRSVSDRPFGVLLRTVITGERIQCEDIKLSHDVTEPVASD